MNKHIRMLTLVAAALALFSSVGCSKLRARDQLNKGVTAYKNAKYEEAIDHFQQSVALDPSLINAKMYLATAFAQQYIPGVEDKDNMKMADQAIEQYKKVLDMPAAARDHVDLPLGRPGRLGAAKTAERTAWHAIRAHNNGAAVDRRPAIRPAGPEAGLDDRHG